MMERLTRSEYGEEQLLYACDNCIRGLGADNPPCAVCEYENDALEKLAAYENTGLTPERCAELARHEAEGRLVALPLAEGTPFFEVRTIFGEPKIIEYRYERTTPQYYIDYLGKTVFLAREEAEAALAKSEEV